MADLPIVTTKPGEVKFNYDTDYEERWGSEQPSSDTIGEGGSTAMLVAQVRWNSRYDAVLSLLGYQYVDTRAASPRLIRVPPQKHPDWPWLYASRVANITGLKPLRYTSGFTLKGTTPQDLRFVGEYQLARISIMFDPLPFKVGYPASVSTVDRMEYHRYISAEVEPYEECLLGQVGTMQYAEGSALAPKNLSFPGTTGLIYGKTLLKVTWWRVPEAWIMDITNGSPIAPFKQHDKLVGKVNDAEFWGFPASTLRMKPASLVRYAAPVVSTRSEVEYLYNITFNFEHFDPTRRNSDTYRGHDLLPWRQDRKFYLATSTGETSGQKIFESGDFRLLFSHHSVASL